MQDAKGYHKSLFAAMNPDAIANHFYEQGKADAVKDVVAKSIGTSMKKLKISVWKLKKKTNLKVFL